MADDGKKLDLVFLWHMHQPDYRDHDSGEFRLPWVYLHALKDYTDMAAHLERHPSVRAVVNFVPVLLDQIDDYVAQFDSGRLRDPLLRMLERESLDGLTRDERRFLLDTCFHGNHARMVAPFPRYQRLHELCRLSRNEGGEGASYLSGVYFADLVTWYHLVWTGETERRRQPLLAELMSKGEGFSGDDRRRLLAYIGDTLRVLIPRYRSLADRGQIELSPTPQTHPLAPLLIDFACAREATPDVVLPAVDSYPGGRTRAAAQIAAARDSHTRRFGKPPNGLWPAEGAVSGAFLQQIAAQGFRWAASSEGVLVNSLRGHGSLFPARADYLYRPWQLAEAPGLSLFFRDERLSDLIGFEYAKWHGRDAAHHFLVELDKIRQAAPAGQTPLVSVILDGENAWEYYPYNAYYFFDDLYAALGNHGDVRTTTFSARLAADAGDAGNLPALMAGSWVYGTFTTWIGDPDKNRAWELLCSAKQSYDLVAASGRLEAAAARAAEAQLAVCEGSDWFWWFGDYNPQSTVAGFDHLFRRNLARLYRLMHLPVPPQLDLPVSRGGGSPEAGGTMRRAS